jgi:hypothetical protein
MSFGPPEANSPLTIDANTVLSLPIANQLFKAIAWWNPQVLQGFRRVQY